jgi:hypothetical protein
MDVCRQLTHGALKHLSFDVDRNAFRLDRARDEMTLNDISSYENRLEIIELETRLAVRKRMPSCETPTTVQAFDQSIVVFSNASVASKANAILVWTVLHGFASTKK